LAWQTGETFLLEHRPDGHGAAGNTLLFQRIANIIDGEVLLSQGDDLLTDRIFLFLLGGCHPFPRPHKELAPGVLSKLVDQHAKAALRVAEAPGRLGPGESLDKIRPESFVLALRGTCGTEKGLSQIR